MKSEFVGLTLVLAALVAAFGVGTEHFFSLTTFRTIANQVPESVLVATGLTAVLLVAGIDLSVGSVLALSSAVLGLGLVRFGLGLPLAVAAALLTGGVCGALNGLFVVRFALPSFIVTLGMLEMARGATYLITRSQTQYVGARVERMAEASIFGLSAPFLLALAIVALGQLVLSRTVFGRYLVAIGTNEEAVRLSGIDPRPIKLAVFVLSGLFAAAAGIVYTARLASADPNAGIGFELSAIAAVVVGGTSLMGGRGSVLGSFLGVLVIAVLGSGLAQIGAQEPTKRLVTGLVIVAAVVADRYRHRSSAAA
jgi:ribose transport system permease protein